MNYIRKMLYYLFAQETWMAQQKLLVLSKNSQVKLIKFQAKLACPGQLQLNFFSEEKVC